MATSRGVTSIPDVSAIKLQPASMCASFAYRRMQAFCMHASAALCLPLTCSVPGCPTNTPLQLQGTIRTHPIPATRHNPSTFRCSYKEAVKACNATLETQSASVLALKTRAKAYEALGLFKQALADAAAVNKGEGASEETHVLEARLRETMKVRYAMPCYAMLCHATPHAMLLPCHATPCRKDCTEIFENFGMHV